MYFRKATGHDIESIESIYQDIHAAEEQRLVTIGWIRGVYPTKKTAEDALKRGDLFVQIEDGQVVGAAIINQQQVDVYELGHWKYFVSDENVMVLHTLVISPKAERRGDGTAFVKFYEEYAQEHGCNFLRLDTNAKNERARSMYKKLGYDEIGIVPCIFNGIEGVQLVLLEKKRHIHYLVCVILQIGSLVDCTLDKVKEMAEILETVVMRTITVDRRDSVFYIQETVHFLCCQVGLVGALGVGPNVIQGIGLQQPSGRNGRFQEMLVKGKLILFPDVLPNVLP